MQNRYPNTQIHDLTLSWLGADTSIKGVGVKLVLRTQTYLVGDCIIDKRQVSNMSALFM